MFKDWLKALFRETSIAAWALFGAASTIATFFPNLPHGLRLVALVVAPISFAWANYEVFVSERGANKVLSEKLSRHEAHVSKIVIEPDGGSRYMLQPVENIPRADFLGGCFEFRLRIENTGRRNSTITAYCIRVCELNLDFPNLTVAENQTMVRSRRAHMGVDATRILSRTGIIEVPAEGTTRNGSLLFYIPDINLEAFAAAGLRMEGQDRKFPPLHCTLTISDSTGTTASSEFILAED